MLVAFCSGRVSALRKIKPDLPGVRLCDHSSGSEVGKNILICVEVRPLCSSIAVRIAALCESYPVSLDCLRYGLVFRTDLFAVACTHGIEDVWNLRGVRRSWPGVAHGSRHIGEAIKVYGLTLAGEKPRHKPCRLGHGSIGGYSQSYVVHAVRIVRIVDALRLLAIFPERSQQCGNSISIGIGEVVVIGSNDKRNFALPACFVC